MIDPLNTMLDQYAADKALPDAWPDDQSILIPNPSDIPTEDFERLLVQCLVSIIESDGPHGLARRILAIDGIGTILSKELSNDVLEAWEQEKTDEEEAENPYEHDSSYDGCTVECKACAWEVDHL